MACPLAPLKRRLACRGRIGPLLHATRHRRTPNRPGWYRWYALGYTLCAFLVLAVSLWPSGGPEPIDTRNWGLAEFVAHLRRAGLQVRAIPTGGEGKRGSGVYLSEDPQATWLSFQHKSRTVERIAQWRGAVWVEHLAAEAEEEWPVLEWGDNGCQIGRFVVFGDARLVEQIRKAFTR